MPGTILAALLLAASAPSPAPAQTDGGLQQGIQIHPLWQNVDSADRLRQLDWAKEVSADIVRADVGWSSLQEGGPNSWSSWYLARLDSLVAEAKARGIKLLITLTWSPCWASSAPPEIKQDCAGQWWTRGVQYYAPTDNAAYGRALAFLIRRYGSDVAAWEIWNEPNLDHYFKASDPAVAYANLVKTAYPIAKQADPRAKIVAGSLSESDTAFLERLYKAGMGNNFDAFSIHPYAGEYSPLDPLQPQYAPYSFFSGPPLMRKALLAHGADVPIWLTEFGWSTNLIRNKEPWRNGVSEATQAEYLKLAFAQAAKWPYVEAAFWFNIRDTTSDRYDVWGNAGLRRYDNTARPAFEAFKQIATNPAAAVPTAVSTPAAGASPTATTEPSRTPGDGSSPPVPEPSRTPGDGSSPPVPEPSRTPVDEATAIKPTPSLPEPHGPVEEGRDETSDPPPAAGGEPVASPVKRNRAVDVRLQVSGGRRKDVLAVGRVASARVSRVQLTAFRANAGREWRRVAARTAPVRNRRFRSPLAPYRRGKWRVEVVVAGRSKGSSRASAEQGLSSPGKGGRETPALPSEARLFDAPSPGPLPGGGYLTVGVRDTRLLAAVKRRLTRAGFRPARDEAIYGPATRAAVRRFQRAHGLLVDGIVGRQTAGALREYR